MAFKVQGEIAMDGSKFFGVMAQAGATVNRFGNSITQNIGGRLAAAFSVGAIGMAINRTLDYADSIEELAQKIGVSTDKLQEWSFAAKQNGTDVASLTDFILKLTRAAQDAGNAKGFAALGINPQGMTAEGLFQSVSSATRGKSFGEINKIMGELGMDLRGFKNVINLLQSDLDEAGKSARSMGAVMDQQTIHALAALNDQLSIIGQVLMSQFGPALLLAGKLAVEAFGRIKGAGAWWGAQTANITPENIGQVFKTPWGDTEALKQNLRGLLPDEAMRQEASAGMDREIKAIEALIQSLEKFKSPALPTIGAAGGDAAVKAARQSRASIASDSLVSVGNFLGSSRNSMETLARRQVTLLEQIARNTTPQSSGESGFTP